MPEHHPHIRWAILLVVGASFFIAGFFSREMVEQQGKSFMYFLPPELHADNAPSPTAPAPALAQVAASLGVSAPLADYIEVTDGCGPYWEGGCLHVRSGPGEEFPVVYELRTGVVLRVGGAVTAGGRNWYKIVFDEWLWYPERVSGDWYVAADYVRPFSEEGLHELASGESVSTNKRIVVKRLEQMLYAYDGDTLFMQSPISTGLEFTPTPLGTFSVYKKSPTRYMQGPIPNVSDQYYDLPGVPWNLYFTYEGGVVHGAYWHDHFGRPWSHGCVNLPLESAQTLYHWAPLGTPVIVEE